MAYVENLPCMLCEKTQTATLAEIIHHFNSHVSSSCHSY